MPATLSSGAVGQACCWGLQTQAPRVPLCTHAIQSRASQVALVIKNPPVNAGDTGGLGSIPGLGRAPGGEHGSPLQPVFLPRESRGQGSLVDCSSQGHKESDMTEVT